MVARIKSSDNQVIIDGVPSLTAPSEWVAQQTFNATTLVDAANISWDLNSNQAASITLTDNRILDNPTNLKNGGTYILKVIQDAIGSRTLTYGSAYKFPDGAAPVLTTTPNAVDILSFYCDGTNMFGFAAFNFS